MKYPKVLQVLLVASMVSTAAPGAAMPVYASTVEDDNSSVEEERETPEEYEKRTEYELPEGFHYVLEDEKYVILDEDGLPVLEKDEEEDGGEAVDAESNAADVSGDPSGSDAEENKDGEAGADADQEGEAGDQKEEDGEEAGDSEDVSGDEGETGNDKDADDENHDDADADDKADDETGDSSGDAVIGGATINGGVGSDEAGKDNNAGGSNADVVIGNKKEIGIKGEAGGKGKKKKARKSRSAKKNTKKSTGAKPALEPSGTSKSASELVKDAIKKQAETDADFETSAKFLALGERIRYNVDVPIEGLPSFITQEMVIGALKAQDETGYPASVTIAQIIQESGYGKYGPGGKNGEGLSYLAYQYCNLFGIKGKGTIGSANMNTFEMTADGQTYAARAGFRAYNTYTECIEDRSELLDEVYSDLTEDVTDANTFAVRIGSRWATDINYSRSLIRTMERYDLYRLDEMTLKSFSKMIGRFADPCPGARVSSNYGYRTFDHSFHKGLDLGTGTENIPTYAADAGTVIFAGSAGTAGNMVVIDHGDGLVTKYMHHYEVFVEEGQEVEKGQQIGLSGTTGYSTGNHLHFQVEENGKAVDPMKYLSDEGTGEIVKMRDRRDLMADRAMAKANRFNADKLAEELDMDKVTAKLRDCLALR